MAVMPGLRASERSVERVSCSNAVALIMFSRAADAPIRRKPSTQQAVISFTS